MNRTIFTAIRAVLIVTLFGLTSFGVHAQTIDTSLGWNHALVASVNLSQIGFTDWALTNAANYLAVQIKALFLNEPDVSPFTQIKEELSIGISYSLL